jgi:putative glutamate/gamma-aminobutyrate antiporter
MANNNSAQDQRILGVFVLAMISVALIAGLRGLPSMAEYGYGSIFFYILVAITFLVPVSLVSAELATGWPVTGGVYVWVKEAFGERWGFMAVWLQWIENVFWYPSQLSFTAGALAYLFTPSLANNRFYMSMVILVAFWGATFINFKGIKASGMISTVGVIIGTILPGVLIMILAAVWLLKGNPAAVAFKASDLIPDMGNINNLVFAAGAFLTFAGMEVSAVHAKEVRNPQRDYPRAIFLAAFIATAVFVLATLAIAILVPKKDINIVYGIMQAFETFFAKYNMEWMVRVMGVFISIGAIAMVSTWVIGPSKGLFAAGKEGNMPPVFQKTNAKGVPVNVLWGQGVVVTLLALLFFLLPSVQASFWIMIALSTQLYLIMYVMMYAAAIKLRYSHPEVKRAYNVPGGKPGMWIVAGGGAVIAVLVILIGFLPPSQLGHSGLSYTLFYVGFLLLGIVFMVWVPLYAYHRRRPDWIAKAPSEKQGNDGNNKE